MQTVHALWWPGRGLALWGEDADSKVKSPSSAFRSARPHTFAAPAKRLGFLGGTATTATLALPSALSTPLDSPELLRTIPRPAPKSVRLMPWTTPVVLLDASGAFAWLTRLSQGEVDAEEDEADPVEYQLDSVRLGASVHFFMQLAIFAGNLAGRGQYLPTLVEPIAGEEDPHAPSRPVYHARWRAIVQGADARFAATAVAALPPVARALISSPDDLVGVDPTLIVDEAVDAFLDAAVRRRLADENIHLGPTPPPRRGRARVAAPEAFLDALGAATSQLRLTKAEASRLRTALAPWDGVGRGRASDARLHLRLMEPDLPSSPWTLVFSLQSAGDETLVVEAEQIWRAGASLDRWMAKPDQILLTELGRATEIWPDLAAALRQAEPSHVRLDAAQVVDFLTDVADRLRDSDIAVLVPNWWGRRRVALRGYAAQQPGGPTEGMMTKDSLCQFSWKLAVGQTILADDEIEALALSKTPLVHLRGGWVIFDPHQVRRGLEFLKRKAAGEMKTIAEVVALATGLARPDVDLPVDGCEATGALGDLLAGNAEKSLTPIKVPPSFAATLRPYQERGLSWLAFLSSLGFGACLADDMGLGKTVQLLALEAHERRKKKRLAPSLLICPVSVVGNWQAESARFAPKLAIHVHHGPGRLHGEELCAQVARADIVITTYQMAVRDEEELSQIRWRRVVLDEAQMVKNAATRGAKAVRALPSDHRVAMTGTPMENKLAELRSIMDFANPGILGTSEQFRVRFAQPIESGHAAEAAERLRAITRPFILRRLKTDKTIITDLPEKIETKQICLLTEEQASLYAAVLEEMMDKIETSHGIERRGNVLAAMTKLKQICNHPAQFLHDHSPLRHRSGKIARLDQIVEEILAEGKKALIFTQFTEFGDMLLRHLSARFNRDVLYLHGQVSATRRGAMVKAFGADDGPDLFLLSLRAGGTGLNLTAASHVIHVDRWWNPAVEDQATDRAYRIGQDQRVQVHTFVCRGTLEERIDKMIEQKKALADLVIGDGEGWLTELSTEQLRSVFALSKEAIDV